MTEKKEQNYDSMGIEPNTCSLPTKHCTLEPTSHGIKW